MSSTSAAMQSQCFNTEGRIRICRKKKQFTVRGGTTNTKQSRVHQTPQVHSVENSAAARNISNSSTLKCPVLVDVTDVRTRKASVALSNGLFFYILYVDVSTATSQFMLIWWFSVCVIWRCRTPMIATAPMPPAAPHSFAEAHSWSSTQYWRAEKPRETFFWIFCQFSWLFVSPLPPPLEPLAAVPCHFLLY